MAEELQVVIESSEIEQAATTETVETPQDDTAAQEGEQTQAEKTFTQAELNEIVQKEKAKAQSKAERKAERIIQDAISRASQIDSSETQSDGRLTHEEWAQVSKQEVAQRQSELLYKEAAKIDGFDIDDFESLPLTQTIASIILDSDVGAKIMAHMTQNPDEADRISGLSVARQALEMGKLEEKLKSAPRVSSAPPPIKTVGHGGTGASLDLQRASMDDYVAMRAKQGAAWVRNR